MDRKKDIILLFTMMLLSGMIASVTTYLLFSGERKLPSDTDCTNYQEISRNDVSEHTLDFVYASEKSIHAVVHVKTISYVKSHINPFEFFFGFPFYTPQQRQQIGMGSGVIISSDGYIVTNNHVIAGTSNIEVTLNNQQQFRAEVVGADPVTDIALLKIDADSLAFLDFGDSEALQVGEWVLAVGNPFNLTSTVTAGIVSAKGRNLGITGSMGIESFIQTDAAVNAGNSGGALVNVKGELIGINTAIVSPTGNFSGYSFAVPASIVQKVVRDFINNHEELSN